MLMVLLIAVALLVCLALLAWAAIRSWTVFAWITLPPNLLALLAVGMSLSMADRSSGKDILPAGPEVFLLGFVEALLLVLSVAAALLGLCLRGLLHWRTRRLGPPAASNEAGPNI